MNIIKLAYAQLEREGLLNSKNEDLFLLDRAVKIRKHLDYLEEIREKTQFQKLS